MRAFNRIRRLSRAGRRAVRAGETAVRTSNRVAIISTVVGAVTAAIAAIVGWVTGWFQTVWATVTIWYTDTLAFFTQPWDFSQIIAALVLLGGVMLVGLIFWLIIMDS